ncbi:MAG: hypothetical protein L0387_33260 [Acidobacteria bacterium]|nr:hypothetical protein [Acidobacteriota bacterium]MCI0626464.1 hypothetical protein [Acidobacteriota bacterium]MCI0724234.1 hypothetical protein [Acidobacteriota bacterium]
MRLLQRTRMFALSMLCAIPVAALAQVTSPTQEPSSTPAASSVSQAPPGGLDAAKAIYVIPMKDRLEHFLTNELVKWGRFEVTLNPRQADALLSDTTEVDIKQLMTPDAKIRKTSARTRGTAFLIDLKTERVLWSAAKKPSESFFLGGDKSTRELAEEIIDQLRKDMHPKGQ